MTSVLTFVAAAVAEIAGCFAFWAWIRLDKPIWWLVPGVAALVLFAWLLTLVDSPFAGRAYAAYGGVYVAASLLWLWAVEGGAARPLGCDRRDRLPAGHGYDPVRPARRLVQFD